jgi:predicted ATP-binding protein involved in virulence
MKVRELTLQNYRVHAATPPFRFADRFTVIAGINGRGKTALLDGLALLCSRFLPLVSPARSGYRTITPSEVHLYASVAHLGMKVTCAGVPLEYTLTYDLERRKVSTTKLTAAVRREVKTAYGDPTRAGDAAPLAVYYTTDRAGYRLPKKLPVEVPRGQSAAYTGALFNRTVNFRDFMARYRSDIALERDERVENPSYLGNRAVTAISQALTTFLGGFENLRVQEEPLRLLVDKGGVTLDLSQLSDGERSFLALICDLGRRLALANPDRTVMENPLHGAGVVLIDELELHLHPKWQREVGEKLRSTFPNIQFIATTHSPFVIQSLRAGELINLDPDEFGEYADKSIEDIAETVMGVDMPQKSERYLQMMSAAEEYFRLLRAPATLAADLSAAERRLDELSAPFSDDPAFQALLKLERETQLGGGGDAAR